MRSFAEGLARIMASNRALRGGRGLVCPTPSARSWARHETTRHGTAWSAKHGAKAAEHGGWVGAACREIEPSTVPERCPHAHQHTRSRAHTKDLDTPTSHPHPNARSVARSRVSLQGRPDGIGSHPTLVSHLDAHTTGPPPISPSGGHRDRTRDPSTTGVARLSLDPASESRAGSRWWFTVTSSRSTYLCTSHTLLYPGTDVWWELWFVAPRG